VDTSSFGRKESTMPKSRPPYPAEFRQQMVELVRAGRNPAELSREFPCSAQTIRNWVGQAAADAGKPRAGNNVLPTVEREELTRLRRQVRQLQMERDILAKATAWFAAKNGSSSGS
jgi:transposase